MKVGLIESPTFLLLFTFNITQFIMENQVQEAGSAKPSF